MSDFRQPWPTARPDGASSWRSGALLGALLGLGACHSYEPAPLEPLQAVESAVERRSAAHGPQQAVDLATASDWLSRFGPELRDSISAWQAAHARAAIRTPWPDPTVSIGPRFGFGDDVTRNEWSAFGQVTLGIPIGDRRDAADALDRARAEQLRTDAVLAARASYLRLRSGIAQLALRRARLAELEAFANDAATATELARRAVAAGSSSALDLALAELEAARARAVALEAWTAAVDAEHALARLVGVPVSRFETLDPRLLDAIHAGLAAPLPDVSRLRDHLAREHPELIERRAAYQVAESRLRLQIELQYPDLQIGPNYTGENGDDIHVLQLGLQLRLPIFDGNRKAIVTAEAERSQLRRDYDTAAERALADLDAALDAVRIGAMRRRGFRDDLLPLIDRQSRVASDSVRAGTLDALRALQVVRATRQLRADALAADLDQLDRMTALERTVGVPLWQLPGEPKFASWPESEMPWPQDEDIDASDPDAARATLGPFPADPRTEDGGPLE